MQDHPRSRGVYDTGLDEPAVAQGSSPLARGLLARGPKLTDRSGIIPARAGFTHTHPCRSLLGPDHPRSRGVYRFWFPALI